MTNAPGRINLVAHLRELQRPRMQETLIDRWRRENLATDEAPSALQQCVTGAIRGGLLGIFLLAVLILVAWVGFL
ncbi:hypothetical protein PUR23_24475 [Methylorubrum populi]|uniref:hypothetical protein n=1 Tax=Methylorubrum populi TaxID=223967 RepID=UPI0031F953DC